MGFLFFFNDTAITEIYTLSLRAAHPISCGLTQRVEITRQNRGFAIDADSLDLADVEITHLNLNDESVAGIQHKQLPVFSVQYHPEASPGPHDADYLFANFVQAMRDYKEQR